MSGQASFSGKPEALQDVTPKDFLDEIYESLSEEDLGDGYLPRLERNFGGENVFLQTEDYNVFITKDGITFSGLKASMAAYLDGHDYEWKNEVSGKALEKLSREYGIEEPLKEINWY